MLLHTLRLFLIAFIAVASQSAIAQDCDNNNIPDSAEFGPFYPDAGGGIRFDGGNTRAVANTTDFSLFGQSFTIEFWAYREAATNAEEYIFFMGNEAVINQGLIVGFRANQRFTFAFWGNDLETTQAYPPDGQWHHWMCRYDATNNFRWIFRDGVEVAFDIAPLDYAGPAGPIRIGGLIGRAGFQGIVDELRIFDHARTDQQILDDINTQFVEQYRVDTTLPAGLHAYFPFEPGFARCDLAGENDLQGNNILNMYAYPNDENANGVPDRCDPPLDLNDALYVPQEFATIQAAIDASQSGDEIVIAPGVYNEAIVIPSSKTFTLRGAAGAEHTIITPPINTRGITVAGPSDGTTTTIEQITIMGSNIGLVGFERVGPAIYINGGRVLIQDCRFLNNSILGSGTVYALSSQQPIQILRCSFENNYANRGAGVFVVTDADDPPVLIRDCLFTRNTSQHSIVLYNQTFGAATIDACTFVNNTLTSPGFSSVVRGNGSGSDRPVIVQNSIFSFNNAPISVYADLVNNFSGDAMLVDAYGGDFRPLPGSPVIDAASSIADNTFARDIQGYPRAIDDPNTPDAFPGNGNGFVADIGAYEYAPDSNNDCIDDMIAYADAPDCNQNGFPDPLDIAYAMSTDIDSNGQPDDCQIDCNDNGIPDAYEIKSLLIADLDANGIPDECQQIENIIQGTFHSTIQIAIYSAHADDIIKLEDGVYSGTGNTFLNFQSRNLTLSSSSGNAQACVIDCQGNGRFFEFNSDSNFTINFEGITFQNAGAVTSEGSRISNWDANFLNCRFFANSVIGFGNGGALTIANSDTSFLNCLFAGNSVGDGIGGALSIQSSAVEIYNSTFTNNSSPFGSAIGASNSQVQLYNTVIWNDSLWNSGSTITADHSLIETGFAGTGNIDADPLFVDPDGPDNNPMTFSDNNYRLSTMSPAIDAGLNNTLSPTDLDNLPRIVNTTIDMGPYEYQGPPPCQPDLNNDGALNFFDVSAFLAAFTTQNPIADFTNDGLYNFFDVSAFLAAFTAGCP